MNATATLQVTHSRLPTLSVGKALPPGVGAYG